MRSKSNKRNYEESSLGQFLHSNRFRESQPWRIMGFLFFLKLEVCGVNRGHALYERQVDQKLTIAPRKNQPIPIWKHERQNWNGFCWRKRKDFFTFFLRFAWLTRRIFSVRALLPNRNCKLWIHQNSWNCVSVFRYAERNGPVIRTQRTYARECEHEIFIHSPSVCEYDLYGMEYDNE